MATSTQSTQAILRIKRSDLAHDRPGAQAITEGELALNMNEADPGLYFKDTAGSIRKVGAITLGANAPNVSPSGSSGNSIGELWADNDLCLNVFDGSSFVKLYAYPKLPIVDTLPNEAAPGTLLYQRGGGGLQIFIDGGWQSAS